MRAKEEAFRILEAALSVASSGTDEAEVAIAGGDYDVTRFSDNRLLPTLERGAEVVSIRVALGGRMVRMTTSDLSMAGVRAAVQQLKNQVEHLPDSAVGFGLPGPQTYQETDGYDPETDALRALDRERLAGQALLLAWKHRLTAGGLVAVQRGAFDVLGNPMTYAVANTRGLLAYHPQTKVSLQYEMRGADGACGWVEDSAFTLAALEPDDLLEAALNRAHRPQAVRQIAAGNYPVVVEPAVVGRLLDHLGQHVGAASAASGASFLAGSTGREVAAPDIRLFDDHTHPLHRGCPFDDEGVARKRVAIIEEGRTAEPVYSWASAQRYSGQPTGHRGVDARGADGERAWHLVLEGDTHTVPDLVAEMGYGLLVARLGSTALTDPRRLAVSGTTYRGLYLVEDGEVVGPVRDMRFATTVLDVLRETVGRSGSVWAAGSVVPALRTRLTFTAPAH